MNIMITSKCPEECSKSLDDLRLRALVREACQIACTALHNLDVDPPEWFYKPFQPYNRFTKWCQSSRANFEWLCEFIFFGLAEMEHRGFKLPWKQVSMGISLIQYRWNIPEGDFWIETCERTRKILDNEFGCSKLTAYRLLLIEKWENDKRRPKWTNRGLPPWVSNKRQAA